MEHRNSILASKGSLRCTKPKPENLRPGVLRNVAANARRLRLSRPGLRSEPPRRTRHWTRWTFSRITNLVASRRSSSPKRRRNSDRYSRPGAKLNEEQRKHATQASHREISFTIIKNSSQKGQAE